MGPFETTMLYAAMPATTAFLGGIVARWYCMSPRGLSFLLHAVVGMTFGVVAVELLPEALGHLPAWLVAVAFTLGGLLFIGVDRLTEYVEEVIGGEEEGELPWVLYIGMAIGLLMDGLLVSTGAAVRFSLGLLLGLGLAFAEIPETLSTMEVFRRKGIGASTNFWLSLSFGAVVILGGLLGYFLLYGRSKWLTVSVVVFSAGFLGTFTVEEITPQAHARGDERLAALSLILSFVLFTLLAGYIH